LINFAQFHVNHNGTNAGGYQNEQPYKPVLTKKGILLKI